MYPTCSKSKDAPKEGGGRSTETAGCEEVAGMRRRSQLWSGCLLEDNLRRVEGGNEGDFAPLRDCGCVLRSDSQLWKAVGERVPRAAAEDDASAPTASAFPRPGSRLHHDPLSKRSLGRMIEDECTWCLADHARPVGAQGPSRTPAAVAEDTRRCLRRASIGRLPAAKCGKHEESHSSHATAREWRKLVELPGVGL